MRPLVMNERLAKKFAHAAVDFSRAEVVVIEKNLELHARLLVVIGEGHRDGRRHSSLWLRGGTGTLDLRFFRDRLRGHRGEREQNNQNSEMHRRSNRL